MNFSWLASEANGSVTFEVIFTAFLMELYDYHFRPCFWKIACVQMSKTLLRSMFSSKLEPNLNSSQGTPSGPLLFLSLLMASLTSLNNSEGLRSHSTALIDKLTEKNHARLHFFSVKFHSQTADSRQLPVIASPLEEFANKSFVFVTIS